MGLEKWHKCGISSYMAQEWTTLGKRHEKNECNKQFISHQFCDYSCLLSNLIFFSDIILWKYETPLFPLKSHSFARQCDISPRFWAFVDLIFSPLQFHLHTYGYVLSNGCPSSSRTSNLILFLSSRHMLLVVLYRCTVSSTSKLRIKELRYILLVAVNYPSLILRP